jgi:hemerythrin superfamily protein
MDAIALLKADHNRVRGLFKRFKAAKEQDNTESMTPLADEILTELDVHATIEEEIFYPWARGLSSEIAETVDEGVEEHHVVKVLMAEIAELEPGDEAWTAKLTVLIENVEHHAEEEETEMFPKIRQATSQTDREQIAEGLEARKKELGAPTLADKIDLTTEELQGLASEQEIPGRSKMDHEELAATVSLQ